MRYNMKKAMIMIAFMAFGISAGAQEQSLAGGIKMYNYKKYKTAEGILTPLADKDPMANYYLGLAYLSTGNTAQAATTFARFPEDPANISGTARVAFMKKDAATGMKIAKDLAAKSKKKEWMQEKYAADAITYTEGGDYTQAAAWYKDALTKSDNAETHIGLGDAMRKVQGGGGEAMTNYEQVAEKDKNNSLAYTRIGDLWYDARNYQSALDNYAKAKNADNANPLPYKSLADAYSRSGNYKQALTNLQSYLEHSDNTDQDQLEYVRAMYQAQSYCDAAKLATKLLSQQSDPATKTELYGILGYSQADCGDSVEALKNVRTYLQLQDPRKVLPGAYIQLGKLYLKLGQLDSAGMYYTKGVSGDTSQNRAEMLRQVAEAYRFRKDWCASAGWYDNIIKGNPNTIPLDYFYKGYTYFYCRNYSAAISSFKDLDTKYPQAPAVYWMARSTAAIDSEATTGEAAPIFKRWIETVGQDYYKQGGAKKTDMTTAYKYLLAYSYNSKDKENLKLYADKLREIDPQDATLKQIEEAEKSGSAPKKTAPAKTKK